MGLTFSQYVSPVFSSVSVTRCSMPAQFHLSRRYRFTAVESPHQRRSSIDTLSDDELYALIDNISSENALGNPNIDHMIPGFASAWRITQDAVVKISPNPSEPFIMSYISSNTSIPIPQVRRVLPWRQQGLYQDQKYVIMDYVDGDLLELAWPTMSWWARIRVIWLMRSHLRQLHCLPLPFPGLPGPFDAHGNSYMCSGFFFTSTGGGPFHSYGELADWFDHRRFDALVYAHRCSGAVNKWWPKFDRTQPLVLCHMDLHMNNIIVDRNGMPWIIDWGYAGAFPAWLDYAHLVIWDERSPKFWIRSARFMVGNYGKYVTEFLNKLYFCWEGPLINERLDYFTNLGLDVD